MSSSGTATGSQLMKAVTEVISSSTSSAPAGSFDVTAGYTLQRKSEGRQVEARGHGGVRSAPAWASQRGLAVNTPRPFAGALAVASSGAGAKDPQKERP
jgi:hypothetical protein